MTEKNVAFAVAYYKAMADKDLTSMARHLHPDVRLVTPMEELTGKEASSGSASVFNPVPLSHFLHNVWRVYHAVETHERNLEGFEPAMHLNLSDVKRFESGTVVIEYIPKT